MTSTQKNYLLEIGKGLLVMFPDIEHGNINFQLNINREKGSVNINFGNSESIMMNNINKKG
jgi:hypothetical protein